MDINKITESATNIADNTYSIVTAVLTIIFMWKIFEKAGEKGWKALIPVYNAYTLFKLVWNTKMFWTVFAIIAGAIALGTVAVAINNDDFSAILAILCLLAVIPVFIIEIKVIFKLGEAFGKGPLFNIGLLFLSVIFYGILAFDDSKYTKPKTK